MKQLLQQYSAYNLWANKIITEKINPLPAAILHNEMKSSFGTIHKTVIHLMDVESIWWQRFKLQEHVEWPGKIFEDDFENLSKELLALSKQWNDWVSETNELQLAHVFGYYNSKKEFFKQPVYEMLLHLFNHQTFHRGQLITMMRQNGIEKLPATDFIVFSRNKPASLLKGR
ncbi:MAG: DinB family protein [Ginsengibacter sp.]